MSPCCPDGYGFAFLSSWHGSRYLSGYVSDLHFWKRSLSIEEMYKFTTCGSFEPGDILPWNADDWKLMNETIANKLKVVTVDTEEFCPVWGQYTFFPDAYTAYDAADLCRRFGGSMVNTTTKAQFQSAVDHLITLKATDKYDNFDPWTRLRDEKVFNEWVDFETGDAPTFSLPWAYG